MNVEFGNCLFHLSEEGHSLTLHTQDIQGDRHTHIFPLQDAFLVNVGGSFWRFVTGANASTIARHLFEDVAGDVDKRVRVLSELGVPILSKEEGKSNLERCRLPVKRLMLTS